MTIKTVELDGLGLAYGVAARIDGVVSPEAVELGGQRAEPKHEGGKSAAVIGSPESHGRPVVRARPRLDELASPVGTLCHPWEEQVRTIVHHRGVTIRSGSADGDDPEVAASVVAVPRPLGATVAALTGLDGGRSYGQNCHDR